MRIDTLFPCLLLGLLIFSSLPLSAQKEVKVPEELHPILAQADTFSRRGGEFFSINLDSSAMYYEAALPLYKQLGDWKSYIDLLNGLAYVNYLQNDIEQYKAYAQNAFELASQHLEKGSEQYQNTLNNLTAFYFNEGYYVKNDQMLHDLLAEVSTEAYSNSQKASVYQNLAMNSRAMNNLQKALDYFKEALRFRQLSDKKNELQLNKNYKDIGLTYQKMEQYDAALDYLNQSLDILAPIDLTTNKRAVRNYIVSLQGLGETSLMNGQIVNARKYLQTALQQQQGDKAYRKAYTYELIARIDKEEKKYEQALENLMTANELAALNYRKSSYPKIARKLAATATIYEYLDQPLKALEYFQKGLLTLAPAHDFNDQWANPPADQLLAPPDALKILYGKAKRLRLQAQQTADNALLETSLQTYEVAVELIREMRQGVLTTKAKNILAEQSVPIYEGGIQAALALYQSSQEESYLETAFSFAENNKAQLLLESINEQKAKGFAGLPDSLREKERGLSLDLAFYQKKILEEKQKKQKSDATKIQQWQDQVFELKQQHEQLNQLLEKTYPLYHQLKYQYNAIQLADIQKQFKGTDQLLLEYFVGEENIYLFAITQNQLKAVAIDQRQEVLDQIDFFRSFINSSPQSGFSASAYQDFTQTANSLHQQLLQPAFQQLTANPKTIIIVPDHNMARIPFGLFLPQLPAPNAGFALDYLLKQYPISYEYSATLWSQNRQKPQLDYDQTFIGFAPTFSEGITAEARSCNANQLSNLKCSQAEIESIKSIVGGQERLSEAASKKAFEQEAANYQILHLATHACIDEANPMFSKIFLQDDYLSIFDLYNTRLQSELVVLSACNTGSGKLLKGEGVMSLARGFITAGCASTVMSLWSVDDCATSDIMNGFYKHLKQAPKNEALRQAKLDYLKTAKRSFQHPYYWAAFVQYGNTRPIQLNSSSWWLYLAGAAVLVVALFLAFSKFR